MTNNPKAHRCPLCDRLMLDADYQPVKACPHCGYDPADYMTVTVSRPVLVKKTRDCRRCPELGEARWCRAFHRFATWEKKTDRILPVPACLAARKSNK